jgi:hypothetical protein
VGQCDRSGARAPAAGDARPTIPSPQEGEALPLPSLVVWPRYGDECRAREMAVDRGCRFRAGDAGTCGAGRSDDDNISFFLVVGQNYIMMISILMI